MKPNKLRTTALDLLREHKTIAEAAKPLAALIARDAELRLAIATNYLKQIAPKTQRQKPVPHARRRAGPHRSPRNPKSKLPTTQQKTGAIRAERDYTDAIFTRKLRGGRRLGDVRVHELRAIAEAAASTATSFLTRGYEDAVETIACTMLAHYCVAADPFALIKDTIKPAIVASIYERAEIKAAETIRDGSAKMAKDLLAIAAAQEITIQ